MATIQRYTATGGGLGTPDSPTHIYPDATLEAVGQLGQQVETSSQTAASIYGRIKSTQDHTTFASSRSTYNAKLEQAQADATLDPRVAQNPLDFERVFAEKQQQIQESLLRDAPNDSVRRMLSDHFKISDPPLAIAAQKQGMKLAVFNNDAKLDLLANQNKELASATSSSILRDSYIEQVKAAYDVSVASGMKNEKVAQHEKLKYEQDVLAANAKYFRRTDPAMFEKLRQEGAYSNLEKNKLNTIIAQVVSDKEKEARLNEHQANLMTKQARNDYYGQAYAGTITQATIEQGKLGKDPLGVPASEWYGIEDVFNNRGKRTASHPAVRTLVARHFSADNPDGTIEHIQQSRQEANDLAAELGQVPDDLLAFTKHLAAAEVSLRNTGRVVQNQDLTKATNLMDNYLKETFKPGSPFITGGPQAARNKLTSETAAAHQYISEFARNHPGADVYKEAERWIAEQKQIKAEAVKNQPARRKTLKDLLEYK